jgi:uncharacterized SAM-binding protein YcdF (DUF218 family)
MLMALKSLLHTLLLPPAGPLLVAAVGAGLIRWHPGGRARRAGWALLVAGLATLWLLATPRVSEALSRVAQRCPPLDLSRPVTAQAIVILGGEGERLDAPEYGSEPAVQLSLLERVGYGAYVARRTHLPVLVSGTAAETRAMRAALARDFNIETRWVENRSQDTFENAAFSARLLKPEGATRIILVTSAEHEWRAMREFASAGFSVVPAPVGLYVPQELRVTSFVPNGVALMRSSAAAYELIGDAVRATLAALHLRRQTP